MPHDTVIRIPHLVRDQFNSVQAIIEGKTQSEALTAIIDWLTTNTPEAQEALKSIAMLKLSRRMAKLTVPVITVADEAGSPSLV